MGNETIFDYKYMNDKDIHKVDKEYTFPLKNVSFSSPIVSDMKLSNGIGGYFHTSYKYKNGHTHLLGRGFIGFEQFIQKDEIKGHRTTRVYEDSPYRYIPGLKKEIIDNKGSKLSETEYQNKLRGFGFGASFFVPECIKNTTYDFHSNKVLSTSDIMKQYDNYGNVTKEIQIINGKDSIVTTNRYDNLSQMDMWILGIKKSSTIETKRDDHPGIRQDIVYEYETDNIHIKKIERRVDGNTLYTESFKYDLCGNLIERTKTAKEESRTEYIEYDNKYRFKTKFTDAENHTTSYEYNEATTEMYKENGADGMVMFYNYDAFLNTYMTRRINHTKTNTLRWCATMEDVPMYAKYCSYVHETGKSVQLTYYDGLGRELRKQTEVFGNKIVYQDKIYDSVGNLAKESEPYFKGEPINWIEFRYSWATGELLEKKFPDNTSIIHSYNGSIETGKITRTTDRIGNETEKVISVYGELIKATDAKGNNTTYTYNSQGKCIQIEGVTTQHPYNLVRALMFLLLVKECVNNT